MTASGIISELRRSMSFGERYEYLLVSTRGRGGAGT
jgi:hypothetical protein